MTCRKHLEVLLANVYVSVQCLTGRTHLAASSAKEQLGTADKDSKTARDVAAEQTDNYVPCISPTCFFMQEAPLAIVG